MVFLPYKNAILGQNQKLGKRDYSLKLKNSRNPLGFCGTRRSCSFQRRNNFDRLVRWPSFDVLALQAAELLPLRHVPGRAWSFWKTLRSEETNHTRRCSGHGNWRCGTLRSKVHLVDGHNLGIYSFDNLRRLCECAHCKRT